MGIAPGSSPWTDDRIAILKQEWAKGTSAFDIAVMVGGGVGKNGVVGKAGRLKLGTHPTAQKRRPKGSVPTPRKQFGTKRVVPYNLSRKRTSDGPEPIAEVPKPADFLGLTILEVKDGQCRFPAGDPPTLTFCAQPVRDGQVYCGFHCRIAYNGFGNYSKSVYSSKFIR